MDGTQPSPSGGSSTTGRQYGRISTAVRVFVAFFVFAPTTAVYALICLLLVPFRSLRIRAGNLYGKVLGPLVFGLAGIRPRIKNRERIRASAPALYVCNHTSTIDMWVGMWLCPFGGCGVAKKEIVRIPFIGQAFWLSGHLLLDRGDREKAIASMENVREVVRKHRLSLWMWPEGTRSPDGRLQSLKKGFVHLAIATGLPIVPVVFHDADKLWPGRTFRVIPGDLQIEVLEPLDTSGWSPDRASEHALELWSIFQAALGARQKGLD